MDAVNLYANESSDRSILTSPVTRPFTPPPSLSLSLSIRLPLPSREVANKRIIEANASHHKEERMNKGKDHGDSIVIPSHALDLAIITQENVGLCADVLPPRPRTTSPCEKIKPSNVRASPEPYSNMNYHAARSMQEEGNLKGSEVARKMRGDVRQRSISSKMRSENGIPKRERFLLEKEPPMLRLEQDFFHKSGLAVEHKHQGTHKHLQEIHRTIDPDRAFSYLNPHINDLHNNSSIHQGSKTHKIRADIHVPAVPMKLSEAESPYASPALITTEQYVRFSPEPLPVDPRKAYAAQKSTSSSKLTQSSPTRDVASVHSLASLQLLSKSAILDTRDSLDMTVSSASCGIPRSSDPNVKSSPLFFHMERIASSQSQGKVSMPSRHSVPSVSKNQKIPEIQHSSQGRSHSQQSGRVGNHNLSAIDAQSDLHERQKLVTVKISTEHSTKPLKDKTSEIQNSSAFRPVTPLDVGIFTETASLLESIMKANPEPKRISLYPPPLKPIQTSMDASVAEKTSPQMISGSAVI